MDSKNRKGWEAIGEVGIEGKSMYTEQLQKRRSSCDEQSQRQQPIEAAKEQIIFPATSIIINKNNNNNKNRVKSFEQAVDALYRFTRPYSIFSMMIVLLSASLLTVEDLHDISPAFFATFFEGTVIILLMVIFGVGVNQICDLEIDKINKPYLPLASGELSIQDGILVCSACAILSLAMACRNGSLYLIWIVIVFTVAGLVYSVDLPLLRWKKYPLLATLSIIGVRASTQTIFYMHMQTSFFGRPLLFSYGCTFGIVIIGVFSMVTSLFKDIPDIEGDQSNGIITPAVLLGVKKMFWVSVLLLELACVCGIIVGINKATLPWSRYTMVGGHSAMALILWYRAKRVDIYNNDAVSSFYMLLWQLMCAEFMLITLLR